MPSSIALQNVGVGPCRGETCFDMLEAMARIAPSQPNEGMARIISLDPSCRVKIPEKGSFDYSRFEIVLEGPNRFKKRIGLGCSRNLGSQSPNTKISRSA
jgi:hypothetical protein